MDKTDTLPVIYSTTVIYIAAERALNATTDPEIPIGSCCVDSEGGHLPVASAETGKTRFEENSNSGCLSGVGTASLV